MLGLMPADNEKEEGKEEEEKKIEEDTICMMTIQEAKMNDKSKKNIYPKYLLCSDFGYCQYIQSDGLYEIYDTELLKQAEILYEKKIEKEKQRKLNIAKTREDQIENYIKQRMSSIFSGVLKPAKNLLKLEKKNEQNFEFKEVVNGERGQILVATPINLQAAQVNQGMEKFIDPFQSPIILRKRSSLMSPVKTNSNRSLSFG